MDSEISKYHLEKYLVETLITPELLHTIEIWSRYKGVDFYAHNTLIRDRGQIKIHGGRLCDVTEIYDTNCSVVKNPRMVIMAEVYNKKKESMLDFELFPPSVYVYNIDEAHIDDDGDEYSHYPDISKFTQCPTFERLKSDLEGKDIYPSYLSMIQVEDSTGLTYKLYAPNQFTDRINLFFNLQQNLIFLNEKHINLLGKTKENKRVRFDEWSSKVKTLTDKTESEKGN